MASATWSHGQELLKTPRLGGLTGVGKGAKERAWRGHRWPRRGGALASVRAGEGCPASPRGSRILGGELGAKFKGKAEGPRGPAAAPELAQRQAWRGLQVSAWVAPPVSAAVAHSVFCCSVDQTTVPLLPGQPQLGGRVLRVMEITCTNPTGPSGHQSLQFLWTS